MVHKDTHGIRDQHSNKEQVQMEVQSLEFTESGCDAMIKVAIVLQNMRFRSLDRRNRNRTCSDVSGSMDQIAW